MERAHDHEIRRHGPRTPRHVEWPTILVAGAIAGGFASLALLHGSLPAPVTIVALGVLSAWYGSLRHEVVHGHPTPSRRLNTALVAAPLSLTEPFWHYRDAHLQHHATDDITDPGDDPESQYLPATRWTTMGPVRRRIHRWNTTLAGRLVIGPWCAAAVVLRGLADEFTRRPLRVLRFVAADATVVAAVMWAGLPLWQYLLGATYLGTSLTLVRSFAEHRAVPDGSRTAVVLGHGAWALLFLNNNLHVTHHRAPSLAWYRLPAEHAASDDDRVAAAGAGLYSGYGEVFVRFLVRPIGPAVDPLERAAIPTGG